MNKIVTALLAAAAMGAVAAPALAHDRDEQNYGQYFGSYQSFDELYQHDYQGIEHGMSDGSYSPREARYFLGQLRQIRQREMYYRSRDGYLDPREGQEIRARLERLHEVMHQAHEDGHAAQDDWNATSPGYGSYGYYRHR